MEEDYGMEWDEGSDVDNWEDEMVFRDHEGQEDEGVYLPEPLEDFGYFGEMGILEDWSGASMPQNLLQKETMLNTFEYDKTKAKIQGLSVQVGELFAELYRDDSMQSESLEALEAYKSLRRLLPREDSWGGRKDNRHIGACAAHKATQGF